jgi:hypothetical protein
LRIAENRLLKRLAREKIVLGSLKPGKSKRWPPIGLIILALEAQQRRDPDRSLRLVIRGATAVEVTVFFQKNKGVDDQSSRFASITST